MPIFNIEVPKWIKRISETTVLSVALILTLRSEAQAQISPQVIIDELAKSTQENNLYLPLILNIPDEEYGILAPLFIYPEWWKDSYVWPQFAALTQKLERVNVILSPTGPDGRVQPLNEDYQRGIDDLEAANVGMHWYVDTGYTTVPTETVVSNAIVYLEQYPDSGVCCMLDQVFANDTNPEELLEKFEYYKDLVTKLRQAAKDRGKEIEIIFNPGQRINEMFYTLADKVIIFEGTFADWMKYQPDDYILNNPSKAVVLVHTTPTEAEMQQAVERAASFGINQMYVGSGIKVVGPEPQDPWTTVPPYLVKEAEVIESLNSVAP